MTRFILMQRPADLLNFLFLIMLTSVVSVYHESIPNPPFLICLYSGLILLQVLVILLRDRGRFAELLHRLIFPTVSILVVFDSLESIVHFINPRDIDPLLIKLDYMLLGCYPTVELEKVMSPLLTDFLQVCYTSYYLLAISLGIALYRKRKEAQFDKTLFMVMLCFYLSYAGYLLFPALGPRYALSHLQTQELTQGFISGRIQAALNILEGIKRDAFPSGHTGIALTVLYLAFRFERVLFYFFLPLVAGLALSTVYCRYHYFVDVIGGVLLTLITLMMGELFYGYRSKRINTGS